MKGILAIIFTLVPAAVFAASGHDAHHGNPGWSVEVLYRIINFLILVFGLVYLLKKPVAGFFANRAELLKKSIEESKVQHEKILKEYQSIKDKLSRIDAESQQMVETWRKEAQVENEKITAHARENAVKLKEDAKKIVASEIAQANEELKTLTIQLSRDMAEKMIREEITSQDDDRLTQNFLERLAAPSSKEDSFHS